MAHPKFPQRPVLQQLSLNHLLEVWRKEQVKYTLLEGHPEGKEITLEALLFHIENILDVINFLQIAIHDIKREGTKLAILSGYPQKCE